MYTQLPTIGRINPSFINAPDHPYVQQPYPTPAYPEGSSTNHTGVNVLPVTSVTYKPVSPPIADYLCYSIFTMLFCCFPLGIVAAIFSAHTQNANMYGQQELAARTSRTALILNNVALGFGITVIVILIVIIIISAQGILGLY